MVKVPIEAYTVDRTAVGMMTVEERRAFYEKYVVLGVHELDLWQGKSLIIPKEILYPKKG